MPLITLYSYWRSSSSYRVRLALAHKGISYEIVPVNLLMGEQKGEAHLRRNPMGYVPCLEVDGRTAVESVAILELLEELVPDPALYPGDAWNRARIRALVEIVNAGTQPLQNLSVLARVSDEAAVRTAWCKHFVERGLRAFEASRARFEAEGVRGPYSCGEAPTAADFALIPQLYSARRFGVAMAEFPRLEAIEALVVDDPRYRPAAPERQPDAT